MNNSMNPKKKFNRSLWNILSMPNASLNEVEEAVLVFFFFAIILQIMCKSN